MGRNFGRLISLVLCISMLFGMVTITNADEGTSGPSSWAEEEVEEGISKGLVPEDLRKNYTSPVTRGQVAEMFIRLLEKASGKTVDEILSEKGVAVNENAFVDTTDRNVLYANALGIINGVGNNKFAPDQTLKRAQIAAIINRTAAVLGTDTEGYTHGFTDIVDNYAWAYDELGWPVFAEIIKGVGGTRFSPGGDLTTEQAILITSRALDALAQNVFTIFVSPDTSRKGKGTRKSPYGSIQAAVDSASSLASQGYDRIDVVLLEGVYTITESIRVFLFAPEEDKQFCPISIRGMGDVTVSGGITLSSKDFVPASGDTAKLFRDDVRSKIVMVDLKDFGYPCHKISEAKSQFDYYDSAPTLYCNGSMQTIAQYPNDTWINIEDGWITDENGNSATPEEILAEYGSKGGRPPFLNVVNYGDEHSGRIGSWSKADTIFAAARLNDLRHTDNAAVKSFEPADDLVYLPYIWGEQPVRGGLIYFYNIPEELDSPGEYYVTDDGLLYYYPADDFATSRLSLPVSDYLMSITMSDNITISNIHFTLSSDMGIVASGNGITIENCEFSSIQGYSAIKAMGYDISIRGNDIHDCGGHGIQIDSGHFESAKDGNAEIYNNRIYRYGQITWPLSNGVFASGAGILIHHNEIYDSKCIGIYWMKGCNITVEYNDIHDILTAADNLGAVSCGFRVHANNVIRYNYIHNIGATGIYSKIKEFNPDYTYYGSSGISGDNGGSYYEAYGNVIQTVNGNGFQGDGRYIVFRNNLVIDCANWYVWVTSKDYADYFKGGSSNSRLLALDHIYNKAWKELNPDLAHTISDLSQTTYDDPRAWAAPVGNRIENNWIHFNKSGRYFTNWGIAPYSIEDTVFQFSADTIDIDMYERSNENVSVFNSRRDKVDVEALLGETSKGLVELTVEQFRSIGCED
ncbi:MAG: right-handed parallel beta-helix repeat-containing protein [Clostridia bacterium]|nr:right-handed parallel beta-helix repeat-containing protein [Clostridia bacterium]